MNAFGFVYLQYWLVSEVDENFEQYLSIIKEHYEQKKSYKSKTNKKKQPFIEEQKFVPPVLSIDLLNE